MADMSRSVRQRLNAVRRFEPNDRILEVGCGAHGLIFAWEGGRRVGVDPLAVDYSALFPWQDRARTIAAFGEQLPFRSASFDVVLCDNVVDHAERPEVIVEEIARVLKPEGILYFTVNFHHPIYDLASRLHGIWNAAGLHFEITPFADHTVHLTRRGAASLIAEKHLRIAQSSGNVREAKRRGNKTAVRHVGDFLKKLFFKNAQYEVVAIREA
jgi:ubiquinone/menaquinone biosynthesis C-methylase UbiE